jgi:hypothetical protein
LEVQEEEDYAVWLQETTAKCLAISQSFEE